MNTMKKIQNYSMLGEPNFEPNQEYTNSDLISALNFYNYNSNHEKIKSYVLDYVKENDYADEIFNTLNNLNKTSFKSTLGALCRIFSRGFPFSDKHIQKINNDISELTNLAMIKKEKTNIIPIKIKIKDNKVDRIINMLEQYIDNYFETKQYNKLKIVDIIKQDKIKQSECLSIVEHFTDILNKIDEPDYYGSVKVYNEYLNILNTIIEGFSNGGYKITRKRIKKEIDPIKLVSKVKYLKEYEEYKSVEPINVLNARNVLIYDMKYKTIRLLVSDNGLTIRGSTIYGFNPENSICKIVKKPEAFLKDINTGNIQYIINAVNAMNTKERLVNGSLNVNTIILRVL